MPSVDSGWALESSLDVQWVHAIAPGAKILLVEASSNSLFDLLTADYTFVDEILGKHYGIPNVSGSNFRRVQLTDENRYGILGKGAILTLTSLANRTSPVARGKYVMEVLVGSPPPPPPPVVPPLKESVNNEKVLRRIVLLGVREAEPGSFGRHGSVFLGAELEVDGPELVEPEEVAPFEVRSRLAFRFRRSLA